MEVQFARTRFFYHPYLDFFRLAELAGYPVVYLDEVDWDKSQIVISSPHNGEHLGVPKNRRAVSVLWNIERPDPGTDYRTGGKDLPYGIDEVWVSDAEIAHITGARFVFLGGHRDFAGDIRGQKHWDVISLMAMFGRRTGLPVDLAGLSWADIPGGTWGDERHKRLLGSRVMLSVHQDNYRYIEPPRFMLAGCYALPLVAEPADRYSHWVPYQHFIPCELSDFSTMVRYLLTQPVRMARLSVAIYKLVCIDYPFKAQVEQAARDIAERAK